MSAVGCKYDIMSAIGCKYDIMSAIGWKYDIINFLRKTRLLRTYWLNLHFKIR